LNIQPNNESAFLFSDAAFDVIAIASSAGGLKALTRVLSDLPGDFPAAILVVQHLQPCRRSWLAEILSRCTPLQVKQADGGDRMQPGHVYIAPPDYHLLADRDGTLSLSQSERVNFVRPAADILFRSVANCYKQRAIAVVLSGTGKDGGVGIEAIKQMQGTVIVQDRQSSDYFGMPETAISTGKVDLILPLSKIASALVDLVTQDNRMKL